MLWLLSFPSVIRCSGESVSQRCKTVYFTIIKTTLFCSGYTLGAMLGGLVYQNYGAIALFRGVSVMCFAYAIIYWICFGQYGICKSQESVKNASEPGGE